MNAIKVACSILSADFTRLGEQVAEAEEAGADRIHVDVMDGHFVPNLTFGPTIVKALRRATRLSLETHLMITNPDSFVDKFVDAGSDSLLVHWEGNNNLHRTIQRVRILGRRVGVVINPATPAAILEDIIRDVDQVLVMTVNPGFGSQPFLHSMVPKIRHVYRMMHRINPWCELEVDGGIDTVTGALACKAGATVLVAGSAIFDVPQGVAASISKLRTAGQKKDRKCA